MSDKRLAALSDDVLILWAQICHTCGLTAAYERAVAELRAREMGD